MKSLRKTMCAYQGLFLWKAASLFCSFTGKVYITLNVTHRFRAIFKYKEQQSVGYRIRHLAQLEFSGSPSGFPKCSCLTLLPWQPSSWHSGFAWKQCSWLIRTNSTHRTHHKYRNERRHWDTVTALRKLGYRDDYYIVMQVFVR